MTQTPPEAAEALEADMSWIDIAVPYGGVADATILDCAEGWREFLTENFLCDCVDGKFDVPEAPGLYRWSGFKIGSWGEDDLCQINGGSFEKYTRAHTRNQPSREEMSDQQVEALARLLIQQRGVSPDTLHEHHEWEDFPVDERIDRQDPFTGEPRITLMHRAWRRRVKDAREILALTGSSAGEARGFQWAGGQPPHVTGSGSAAQPAIQGERERG